MTEIELSDLAGQCLNRRIEHIDAVRREVKAWEKSRNNKITRYNRHFTTDDARIKLITPLPDNTDLT